MLMTSVGRDVSDLRLTAVICKIQYIEVIARQVIDLCSQRDVTLCKAHWDWVLLSFEIAILIVRIL